MAFRNGTQWNLDAAFTNFDPTVELPNFERWYGGEIMTFKNDRIDRSMQRYRINACDIYGNLLPNKTGTFGAEVWEGKPGTHTFITEDVKDNRGYKRALSRSETSASIIAESREISQIVIFILPTVTFLFPISLFRKVKWASGLLYAIVTDIASVLPILLKGSQLLYFATQKTWAIVTRYFGDINYEGPAAAVNWISICSMDKSVLIQGIVYVGLGIVLMLVGICLEVYAARKLAKLQKEFLEKYPEDAEWHRKRRPGLLWYWRKQIPDRSPNTEA